MDINIENIKDKVELHTETDTIYNLTNVATSLLWEEQTNELSQRVSLTLANTSVDGTWLMALAKIGCVLYIYSDWGEGETKLFAGKIWDWDYNSAQQKEISLTAYDVLKYLQQSFEYGYYTAGQSTASILNTICTTWGVPLAYNWGSSLIHEKLVFNNMTPSEMILEVVEEVKEKCGGHYVCHWKDEVLTVNPFGTNANIYLFAEKCTMSTSHKISIHDLVTRVKVMGNADDDGRTPVEAVVDGDQSFGVMQKIIIRDTDKTVAEAMADAETYLREHEKPDETITVVTVDIPFLRKGDLVSVCAGDLVGDFYILGVSHNGTKRQMTLTLERKEEE